MHAAREPPGQPEGDGVGGVGVGGAGVGGLGVGGLGVGAGVGAGAHLRGSGPCTTEPLILKLLMEKCEPGRLPEVPQSATGTQPSHSDE
jgi:hypothetical protein